MPETQTLPADTAVVQAPEPDTREEQPLVEDDLLVEDISIDGMCGVY